MIGGLFASIRIEFFPFPVLHPIFVFLSNVSITMERSRNSFRFRVFRSEIFQKLSRLYITRIFFYHREKSNRAFDDTLAWPNMIYPSEVSILLLLLLLICEANGAASSPETPSHFCFSPFLYYTRPVYTSFIRNNARRADSL